MNEYFSKINEYFSKKNLIIGAVLISVLSLMGYKLYDKGYLNNIIDNKNDNINDNNDDNDDNDEQNIEKPKITSKDIDRYIQKEFSKVLKSFAIEAQNTAKKMSEFNRDFLLKSDYLNFRNQLFTKDIEKQIILIDSRNILHTENHNTSNYTIFFQGGDDNNKTSGFGRFKNVIGFRLIEAVIPAFPYHVTSNNNKIYIQCKDNNGNILSPNEFILDSANYTNNTLSNELKNKLNFNFPQSGFNVSFNEDGDLKYKITITSGSFRMNFINENINSSHNILGFLNLKENPRNYSNLARSEYIPDISVNFIDLVVPEIPYNACKKNSLGKNIIDRIPVTKSAGNIIEYNTPITEYFTQNYFYPISLSKITIELYEDQNDKEYNTGNLNNYFEFEITTIKKTDKFNLPHE